MNTRRLQLSRRDFLKLAGTTGASLVLAIYLDACAPASATPTIALVTPTDGTPAPRPPFDWEPNIYLRLDNNGILTVIVFRSEMGQGIRTALAMLVADELDIEWENVRIEQAPADSRYGDQSTGGSRSISSYYDDMRKAGAAARQMLVEAAAQVWGVKADRCQTEAGHVIHPDGQQKIAYGDLVEAAASLKVPWRVDVKEPLHLRIVGMGIGHWDTPDIITGKAIYGVDVRLPDMSFAVIARCPVFGGGFASYDEAAALAVPGVRQIMELDGSVVVVAENTWAAIRGRSALNVTWNEGNKADLSSEGLRTAALEALPKPGSLGKNEIDAVYEIPYEAHATMEPMNCTAYVYDDVCEVWAPTQDPQKVQRDVSAALGISQKNITVHVTLMGGGFGRRLQSDYGVEAARVSQAINAPVQVFWTRDDDLQHDYYHGMSIQYASARLSPTKLPRLDSKGGSGVPTGSWRSVGEFDIAYATQCLIDEMTVALGRDPLDLRLELYKGRAADVIKLVTEKANWGDPLPAGWGRGLAYHATFGVTHVAQVAEISVDKSGKVRVQRVVCAVDCGKVVNPDNIAAQMEGGIVFGLTAALKAEATLENGRIQQSNFNNYPILRMDEMPVVEVYLIDSDERPTGIGEMGVPPIAPAVANAVYAATGKRVRHIPIRPEDLKA
ncbi:MAG: xanthine dehydrogenase family protein molybdopterin-binding subunit [Anaerolineales bacterium]|nr:xanthine dehydrogenase family protein molybdopterin-binding subunit [Anaerolineales bacterium]